MIKINVEINNKSWKKKIKHPKKYYNCKLKKIPKIISESKSMIIVLPTKLKPCFLFIQSQTIYMSILPPKIAINL